MKRVLIADDEPIERMIVTRTIQKYFPEELAVVSAVNGREAVEQFFAENCQIALLDIEMPGMSGLEAAEQIRERDKNCSIIFLTAFDEFNYAKRAIAVRAMEYLLKPVVDQELEAVLPGAELGNLTDEQLRPVRRNRGTAVLHFRVGEMRGRRGKGFTETGIPVGREVYHQRRRL